MDNGKKVRDNKVRRAAKRQGYIVKKSRARHVYPYNINNYGGYMIVNATNNEVEAGDKFNLSLDDVEKFLNEK